MDNKIIAVIALLAIVLAGCSSDASTTTTISKDGSFSEKECKQKGLQDKVLMIESKYCGHCQETKPGFEQALEESGMTAEFYDLAEPEEQKELMDEYGISVQYTPTFVFGCNYYVGAYEKEQYVGFLDDMGE
ncbi:MAG: thioredoxin family protein [Candidatus Woesearchaeota archaeon]